MGEWERQRYFRAGQWGMWVRYLGAMGTVGEREAIWGNVGEIFRSHGEMWVGALGTWVRYLRAMGECGRHGRYLGAVRECSEGKGEIFRQWEMGSGMGGLLEEQWEMVSGRFRGNRSWGVGDLGERRDRELEIWGQWGLGEWEIYSVLT